MKGKNNKEREEEQIINDLLLMYEKMIEDTDEK